MLYDHLLSGYGPPDIIKALGGIKRSDWSTLAARAHMHLQRPRSLCRLLSEAKYYPVQKEWNRIGASYAEV